MLWNYGYSGYPDVILLPCFRSLPDKACEKFQSFGLKPIGSVHGLATMLKRLDTGRHVGYSATWTCPDDTWIATIPVGYADGYWRHLSSAPGDIHGYVIRDNTGILIISTLSPI